jgi:hypothetical protein
VSAADPVAIANAGFEALYVGGNLPPQYAGDVPPGAFPTGDPPAGAPEGDNVALVYMDGDAGGAEFGIAQQLAATLEPDPGYRVQLLAGGAVLAEDAGAVSPGEGEFETATVLHTTQNAPPQQGQPLAIQLLTRNQPDVAGVSGLEVDFDDVRLDAAPAAGAVPVPPAALALAALGLAATGAAALRRSRWSRAGSG